MKNIVVIAHDQKKPELVQFFKERSEWLWGRALIATGKTAEAVEKEIDEIPIQHLKRGRYGGYREITKLIKEKKVDMVVFFMDHEVREHHEDIRELLDACNIENIPLATNPMSAELLIIGLIKKEATQRLKSNS